MIKKKCEYCGNWAEHLYEVAKKKACILCFHASRGWDAYIALGVKVPWGGKGREKRFKKKV